MERRNDMPYLTDGRNHGCYVLEPNKVFTIGRSLGNSLTIEDLKISRTHCVFKQENGMWSLHDQSGNGTYVNDTRVHRTSKILSQGDKIRLSETSIFEFHDAQASVDEEIDICEKVDEAVYRNLRPRPSQNGNLTSDRWKRAEGQSKPETEKKKTKIATVTQIPEVAEAGPSKSTQSEDMENEMMCSICAELFVKAQTLNCSHTFCRMCINHWKKKSKICPICRTKIKTVTPTLVLDNLIDKMMETSPEDVQQQRKQVVAEREQEEKPKTAPKTNNRRTRRNNRNTHANLPPAADVLLISSDDEHDDDDSDPYEFFMMDDDDFHDVLGEDSDDMDYADRSGSDMPFIPGNPGSYYGGYGSCFNCGARGHWSVGCPLR